jgi:hypothetical protein
MVVFDWRGFRWAAVVLWLALALGAAAVALRGFPPRALILALALVASLAFALVPTRLPRLFDLLFVTAAILNAAGYAWNLFGAPGPWDEITHGFTIGTITLGIGYLIATRRARVFRDHRVLLAVMVTCIGIASGAWWEVVEFLLDKLPAVQVINPLGDTISDIAVDSAGSILAALISAWILTAPSGPAQPEDQHDESDVVERVAQVGDDLTQPEGEIAGAADDAQVGHAGGRASHEVHHPKHSMGRPVV